ncbi:MAG: IclR family transcriptional regulator C-terminal domain-containing protein [Lentisphaeria bacterium]|jgi:IclR family acetate operon transcriptional repressor|nr:IclR family transcriptional regulator C-terminal domain-containing protein [Lentisphaeria bacterium]
MAGGNLVGSLVKALDILGVAARAPDGLRLKDIADEMGLKTTTAYNLVRTLHASGYLCKTPKGFYALGPKVDELVAAQAGRRLLQRAEEAMRDLALVLPQATLTFAEPAGNLVVVRLRISPDQPRRLQRPRGRTAAPYSSATGLLFLACGDAEWTEEVRLEYPFHEHGSRLWESPEQLRDYLAEVRAKGFATPPFANQEGLRVAAPVFDPDGHLAASLGVSIPWPEDEAREVFAERIRQHLLPVAEALPGADAR